jgi:hypothetical protein
MTMRTQALAVFLAATLTGCSGDAPPATASAAATTQDAQARVGDIAVHASVMQTAALDEAIARQYGLERSERVAMLLVSVRRDGDAPLPASLKLDARVSGADGTQARPVTLRRMVVDGLVDYVGTVDIAPPESLRFDVKVTYDTASSTLQFGRDFYPR